MLEQPRVRVRPEPGNGCTVVCSGDFDMDTVGLLAYACDRQAPDAEVLVLDVSGVSFADSTFLSVLVRLNQERRLRLAGLLPEQLLRLSEMTGVLAVFEIGAATEPG